MDLSKMTRTLIEMSRVQDMHLTLTMQDVHRATPAGITTEQLIEYMLANGWERHPIGHNFILEIHAKTVKE
jgi:hypothetical protein